MIVLCPHCFMDVVPERDGLCPACKKNPRFVDPAKKDLVPAEFVDGEHLPGLCFVCGQPSHAELESGLRNESRNPNRSGILARILGIFGGAFLISTRHEEVEKEFALSVQLPVCSRHDGLDPVEPLYVDRKNYRLTFPVHRALRDAWSKR